jgi:hypothetical protein
MEVKAQLILGEDLVASIEEDSDSAPGLQVYYAAVTAAAVIVGRRRYSDHRFLERHARA